MARQKNLANANRPNAEASAWSAFYAATLAEKTADHDDAISARNKTYKDEQAEIERVWRVAMDAAQWTHERGEAAAWRQYSEDMADAGSLDPVMERPMAEHQAGVDRMAAIALLDMPRMHDQAEAERDRTVSLAEKLNAWVHDVGDIHVALAQQAKTAADALATGLKGAADTLTGDQAAAARQLAGDLAGAEEAYVSGTAQGQVGHDNASGSLDGTLQQGLVEVANMQREGQTEARGEYETAVYTGHRDAIIAPGSTTAFTAGGGVSPALADVINYQRQVAIEDVAWSDGATAAKNMFESNLSTVYAAHAAAEYGTGGSVPTRTHAAGAAAAARISGLANADAALSTSSTDNLADFTEAAQSAASLAAKDGVVAETQYDVARATAKRDYSNAVADARLIKDTALADNELATMLGLQDLPTRLANQAAAFTAYDTSVAAAKIAHATAIGDAQIAQAVQLGNALVTQTTLEGDALISFLTQQGLSDQSYMVNRTQGGTVATQGMAGAHGNYANAHAHNLKTVISGVGQAIVNFVQQMAPVNVQWATDVTTAEGMLHAAQKQGLATAHSYYIAGLSQPPLRDQFEAAQAAADASWMSAMQSPTTNFVATTIQAQQSESIALAQAQKAAEDAWAQADVIHEAAVQPIYIQEQVDLSVAQEVYLQSDVAMTGAQRLNQGGEFKRLDIAYATAQKSLGVDRAVAEKAYRVALAGLDAGQSSTAVVKQLAVAWANAVLARVTGEQDANVVWGVNTVAADRIYRIARAEADRVLKTEQSRIERDRKIAMALPKEARAVAYGAAQANEWTSDVTASNTRELSEATALTTLRSVDETQRALAVGSIHSTLNLPWSGYQADLAAARRDWWDNSGEVIYLGLVTATNVAELTYQTTINAAYTVWITQSATAQRVYDQSEANSAHQRLAAEAAAEKLNAEALALAEEDWQVERASQLRNHQVDVHTQRRNSLIEHDEPYIESPLTQTLVNVTADRAYFISAEAAVGIRQLASAAHQRNYVFAEKNARLQLVTSTNTALETYSISEATEAAIREGVVATAESNAAVNEASSWESVISDLAAANVTPWASFDADLAAVDEVFAAQVAPAQRDLFIAEANARRDFEIAAASAVRAAEIALESADGEQRLSHADAALDYVSGATAARQDFLESAPDSLAIDHIAAQGFQQFADSSDLILAPAPSKLPPLRVPPIGPNPGQPVFVASPADGDYGLLTAEELYEKLKATIPEKMPDLNSADGEWFTGKRLQDPKITNPIQRANGWFRIHGGEVVKYVNGRPQYKTMEDVLGNLIEVDIETTGNRTRDIELAKQKAIKEYGEHVRVLFKNGTFHHKTFNRKDGKFVMQLVDKRTHHLANHAGAFADWLAYAASMATRSDIFNAAPSHVRKAFHATVARSKTMSSVLQKVRAVGVEVVDYSTKVVDKVSEFRIALKLPGSGKVVRLFLKGAGPAVAVWAMLGAFNQVYASSGSVREATVAAYKAGMKDFLWIDLFEMVVVEGSNVVAGCLIAPVDHAVKRWQNAGFKPEEVEQIAAEVEKWVSELPPGLQTDDTAEELVRKAGKDFWDVFREFDKSLDVE